MLKWQKKQIIDILGTIEEAIPEKLYNDCVVCLQAILKAVPNEKLELVFSDFINQLFENINGGNRDLLAEFQNIKQKINNIKCKREVVFFPYKTAMFDSMHSVYAAFAADTENFDTYCVPIPYFDYKDGKPDKMLCEGEEINKLVPCFHWSKYDVKLRRPDIAFIMNPYDNSNFITSVYVDFYAEELKKNVDYLIYIPYFVHSGAGRIGEYFVVNNGVIYSDRVFVDSDKLKNDYIEVFENYEKCEKYSFKLNLNKKIVAIGSPKYDNLINAKPDDFEIPDEWKALLKDKKVFLYNTSVGGIFGGKEEFILKLRTVLDIFKNRDDVVLWWRPHPLSASAFQSSRSDFKDSYNELVEQYKKDGYGIFDETTELERALVCTDAYYGDASSLVQLYSILNKPIMYQDVLSLKYFKKLFNSLFVTAMCDIGDDLYFTTFGNVNALWKRNKLNNSVEFVSAFPNSDMFEIEYLHTADIIKKGDFLIMPPANSNVFLMYNIAEKEWKTIPLPEPKKNTSLYRRYSDTERKFFVFWNFGLPAHPVSVPHVFINSYCKPFEYDNKLWFFPAQYPGIAILDLQTFKIEIWDGWLKDYGDIDINCNHWLFSGSCCENEKLYLLTSNDKILEIDLNTRKINSYNIGNYKGLYGLERFGGYFWMLTSDDPKLVRFDLKNTKEYIVPECYWRDIDNEIKKDEQIEVWRKDINFIRCLYSVSIWKEDLYLIPVSTDKLLKFNPDTGDFTAIDSFNPTPQDIQPKRNLFLYKYALLSDNRHFRKMVDNDIFEYNSETGETVEYSLRFEDKNFLKEKYLERNYFHNQDWAVWYEKYFFGLNDFIDLLVSNHESLKNISKAQLDFQKKRLKNLDGTAGQKIYEYIKKELK